MLALEDGKVGIKEGAIGFETLVAGHFLLDIIRRVHQVIQDFFLYSLWAVVIADAHDFPDLLLGRVA